jgi:8-oxo-dGTP pyrophosphatase MutT (NUDIX family)
MPDLSLDDTVSRIGAALSARPPRRVSVDGFRRAAVLVPLLARPGGPTLLFTRRTELVTRHRGEISFPGGHLEPGEGPREAALREAREEVALEPASVQVLGELDERPTVTSYVVSPLVGLVREPPDRFRRQDGEVAEVFEVPLATLAAPGLPRGEWWTPRSLPGLLPRRFDDLSDEEIDREGGRYRVWFFDVAPDRIIWGFTARVLKELLDRAVRPPTPAHPGGVHPPPEAR